MADCLKGEGLWMSPQVDHETVGPFASLDFVVVYPLFVVLCLSVELLCLIVVVIVFSLFEVCFASFHSRRASPLSLCNFFASLCSCLYLFGVILCLFVVIHVSLWSSFFPVDTCPFEWHFVGGDQGGP